MGHVDEAAGLLAAAADSIPADHIIAARTELAEVQRFLAAAGDRIATVYGAVVSDLDSRLDIIVGELVGLSETLRAHAAELAASGGSS